MKLVLPALVLALSAPTSAQCELERLDGSHLPLSSQFGIALDVQGDRALVSDWFWEDDGSGTGWVTVYRREGLAWEIEDVLTPGDPAKEAYSTMFGDSVAIDGDRIVVGAPGQGATSTLGKVYFYERVARTWQLDAVHTKPGSTGYDSFGARVALSGDRALVHGDQDVYSYHRVGSRWVLDEVFDPGASFGASLALDGYTALVGDSTEGSLGFGTGVVHVFRHDGSSWKPEGELRASDAHGGQSFGESLDLEGDVCVVGAHWDDTAGYGTGAAYVFRRSGAVWTQEQKLLAADGAQADFFGESVSLGSDRILVGAPGDDDFAELSGAAYAFRYAAPEWVQEAKLLPSQPGISEQFGWRVATDGTSGLVTSPLLGPGPGAVFSFAVGGPDCNGNGAIDACDVVGGVSHDFDGEGTPDECQPLSVDTPTLSVSAGGTQTLSLDAGLAHAGELYVVLGSTSGTAPGTPFGPVHVPLNLDTYTVFTLVHANTGPFGQTAVPLSPTGQGTATITLAPASPPGLAGLELDHAFVIVEASAVTASSNAMPLGLEP